jgi:hypothetical protein
MESQEQYSRRKSLKLHNKQAGMSLEAGYRAKISGTSSCHRRILFLFKKNWESIRDATAELQVKIICLALQISKKLKNSFGGESPKEHLGKVWLKLTKWFQRCVILKITSGRGWGWPRASTLGAFNLSIHRDHKYIWFRGGDLDHYKVHLR